MNKAGLLRIGAMLAVLAVVMGAFVALPYWNARAQTTVWGLVDESGASPPNFLAGVLVSLVDAHGARATLTTTTGPGGDYSFSPPAGSYFLRFEIADYYAAETAPFRFDGSVDLRRDGSLAKMPARTTALQVTVQESPTIQIAGATVRLFDILNPDPAKRQVVASGTTNATGIANLPIWAATFELQVSKSGYEPFTASIDTGATTSITVTLTFGAVINGHAFRAGTGVVLRDGLVGYLYNTNPATDQFKKVIPAKIDNSLYTFNAEVGQTYIMVIDVNGFRASVSSPFVASSTLRDVSLTPSPPEEYRTEIAYNETNWNKIRIDRNLTLLPDSSIPGLDFPDLRSAALQIDYTLGDRDGVVLEAAERTAFQTWFEGRLPFHVTTDDLIQTSSKTYNATGTYTVEPIFFGSTQIRINASTTYDVRSTQGIVNGRPKYFVNASSPNDSNATVYKNQVVVVDLPKAYEMTVKRITGSITTTGFTRITVDPGLAAGTSRIEMELEESETGTAIAMVEGPAGRFHVLNDTKENYTAIVAANTSITFSAEQSIDPVGDIRDGNFTWRFKNNTDPGNVTYGITTSFNYTEGGKFQANLTVTEAGGNMTWRDITLYADDVPPSAVIKHNKTSAANANGTTLRTTEDTPIRFDGSASSDTISLNVTDRQGLILDTPNANGYNWDFDGDGIVDSTAKSPAHSFEKPGDYTLSLQTIDSVGHKSVNATLRVVVNDTTKPTPNLVILDPATNWAEVTSLTEGKPYAFNASSSSDNYDEPKNLTFGWHFPGPASSPDVTLANGNFTGVGAAGSNVTVVWSEFNTSYPVVLNVTDAGFGWNNTAKRNSQNETVNVPVGVETRNRPDLKFVAASLKIAPGQPEEGSLINVSFAIRNEESRANATSVLIRLFERDASGGLRELSRQPRWYDDRWNSLADLRIAPGKQVRLVFEISFAVQGNKSLEIKFNDTNEPYTWVDSQNRVTGSVFVRQAGWVIYAVIGGIIAAIVGVGYGARLLSRYRAGELTFRRPEKKEKKEKKRLESEEKEREPEKKRL